MMQQDKYFSRGSREFPRRTGQNGFEIVHTFSPQEKAQFGDASNRISATLQPVNVKGGVIPAFQATLGNRNTLGGSLPYVHPKDPNEPCQLVCTIRRDCDGAEIGKLSIYAAPVTWERTDFTTSLTAKAPAVVKWDANFQRYLIFAEPGMEVELSVDGPGRVSEVHTSLTMFDRVAEALSFVVPPAEQLLKVPTVSIQMVAQYGDWVGYWTIEAVLIPKAAPIVEPAASVSLDGINLIKAGLAKLEGRQ